MQTFNSQITEQDQQRIHRQLQEHNDDIGVHSEEEDSDGDEYVEQWTMNKKNG